MSVSQLDPEGNRAETIGLNHITWKTLDLISCICALVYLSSSLWILRQGPGLHRGQYRGDNIVVAPVVVNLSWPRRAVMNNYSIVIRFRLINHGIRTFNFKNIPWGPSYFLDTSSMCCHQYLQERSKKDTGWQSEDRGSVSLMLNARQYNWEMSHDVQNYREKAVSYRAPEVTQIVNALLLKYRTTTAGQKYPRSVVRSIPPS